MQSVMNGLAFILKQFKSLFRRLNRIMQINSCGVYFSGGTKIFKANESVPGAT